MIKTSGEKAPTITFNLKTSIFYIGNLIAKDKNNYEKASPERGVLFGLNVFHYLFSFALVHYFVFLLLRVFFFRLNLYLDNFAVVFNLVHSP